MPADGDLAPVVSLDTVRARRRPRVRTTRIPAERGAGVAVLTDAELDDELAAAQQDADAELVELLAGPIPRDEDAQDLLIARLASRLALSAVQRIDCDAAQVDARQSYADDIDALVARLCAVRGAR